MTQSEITDAGLRASDSVLVFASHNYDWLTTLQDTYSEVNRIELEGDLITFLNDGLFAVVILDEALIAEDIVILISELRNRFPILVILVLSTVSTLSHWRTLLNAGADDVMEASITAEALIIRINLFLRQQRKNQSLLRQSHRLHAVNMLSQQFYNATQPSALIVDTIDVLCARFAIYGVAIVIDEGDNLRLYAGRHNVDNQRRLYESTASRDIYDPLHQVAMSGLSIICEDIMNHRHYMPIPTIERPKSAIILPLRHGHQSLGSIALFSNTTEFTMDDLVPYELLATHFANAYYNALHHYDREMDIRSKRQQVRVLQALSVVYDIEKVLQTCHELVLETHNVSDAIVFAFKNVDNVQSVVAYAQDTRLMQLVEVLHKQNLLREIIAEFDENMRPIILNQRQAAQTALGDMFALMSSAHLLLTPISDSMLIGGIFVAPEGNQRFTPQDINLIEHVGRTAAQTIERNTLIDEIQQQKGRLEVVVRSIREAIFFVNEGGRVIFCNPQFTELTGINPSQVIGNPYTDLLQAIANHTDQSDDTYQQLETAISSVLAEDASGEDHPVLDLNLTALNNHIYIEFMKSSRLQDLSGWIGLMRTSSGHSASPANSHNHELLVDIMENVGIPLYELQKTSLMLPEQYDVLRPRQFGQLLARLQDQVQGVQSMWQNLIEVYGIAVSGLRMKMELVNPAEVIEDALKSHRFDKFRRQIGFQAEPPYVRVEMDERHFLRALNNILEFVVSYAHPDAPIFTQVVAEGQFVTINIQEKTLQLADEMLNSIFDLATEKDDIQEDYPYRVAMYVSREIINGHGGQLTVESHRGWGLVIKIRLPIAEASDIIPERAASAPRPSSSAKLAAVVVESPTMHLGNLYDILRFEGHEIFIEQGLDKALLNLSLTQVDLIIVVDNGQRNSFVQMTRVIRDKTDTPLLLVAPQEAEASTIRALSEGADAYVLSPITPEKLMAQMQSVAKRKDLAARVEPPIRIGDLYINFSRRAVYLNNELLDLTAQEYELLQILAMNRDQVMTHQQILTKIWGPEYRDENQYLWVSVSRLRRKLEPTKNSPRYIHTEKGVGYVFREP